MIKFFFNKAPNPMKVALCLEETGLDYELLPVDTRKGEQFAPAFNMAVWGWARLVPFVLGDEAQAQLPHLKRLVDEVNQGPAVARSAARREGFKFKTETDDEARRFLFPQNALLPS